MVRFRRILKRLKDHEVQFVVIGGVAAILHGSPLITLDVDVCAPLDDANLENIVRALRGLEPRWRFRPDRVIPFHSVEPFRGFKNLYLTTTWGILDVLGEVSGVGGFQTIRGQSSEMNLGGFTCNVLDLDTLIRAKTAAGRDKDKVGVRYLEAIRKKQRQEQERPPSD